MTEVHSHAEEIHEQFADQMEITVEEVEERLDTLVNEYQVPIEEARRSVTSSYYDETDVDQDSLSPIFRSLSTQIEDVRQLLLFVRQFSGFHHDSLV